MRARGPSILVLDEDPAVRLLLHRELTAAGYRVRESEPSPTALSSIAERPVDLLILDIDSTGGGGPDAVRIARGRSAVPILAVSACRDERAMIAAFEQGADDCIKLPFSVDELLARAKAALRRRARERGRPIQLTTGELEIDLLHRRVRLRGRSVRLSVKPYEVLRVLAEGAGRVLRHDEILRSVWGERSLGRMDYLRAAIRQLRRLLEADPAHPRYILTEMGVGYRLEIRQHDEPPSGKSVA